MADKVRLTLKLDKKLHTYFEQMGRETGLSFGEILARGIKAIHIAREQRAIGRKHMGFVSDRTKLDAELLLFS